MKDSRFIRSSGIAVIIAAISMLASALIENTPLIIYGVILFGTLIGFIGIHQYQKESVGMLSLMSIMVILLTFVFYGSGSDDLGDVSFPIAFLLLGITSYQAGKFPRWASAALILGVALDFIDSFLPSFPRTADIIDSLVLTAGFFTIGYIVWKNTARPQATT